MQRNKFNDGCLKIFNLLNLLYKDNASYENVAEILKEDLAKNHSRSFAHVIINKYLNTLKVFGIKVVKEDTRYRIVNDLFTMHFTVAEIKAMSILIKALENFPDEKIKDGVIKIMDAINLRMDINSKLLLDKYLGKYDFTFYYSTLKDQIKYCNKLCNEDYIFEIVYWNGKKQTLLKQCKPLELIYNSQNVFFKFYSSQIRFEKCISLSNILSIKNLQRKTPNLGNITTAVYCLKGRLAQTYKLKENETLGGNPLDREKLVVINKNEPMDQLLPRLMRYMDLCEIISPKYLKDNMRDLVDATLKQYTVD